MAGVLDTVDQRTRLAGENRLEILLFQLNEKQIYGINVFKVREVIRTLPLTKIPQSHSTIKGISNIRGQTIPVIDLNMATGGDSIPDPSEGFIIITEYNQSVQGFLVSSVLKIINTNWEEIHPPPAGAGDDCYLTAVTQVDDELVEIIDVEKVLQEISPQNLEVSEESKAHVKEGEDQVVLICDDSAVARKQLEKVLVQLNLKVVSKNNGKEAHDYLMDVIQENDKLPDDLLMLISDVEMPEMDGYKLTTEIRNNPVLKDMYVVLHTSLSGVFNNALIEKVGADKFIPKFQPDNLAQVVRLALENKMKSKAQS